MVTSAGQRRLRRWRRRRRGDKIKRAMTKSTQSDRRRRRRRLRRTPKLCCCRRQRRSRSCCRSRRRGVAGAGGGCPCLGAYKSRWLGTSEHHKTAKRVAEQSSLRYIQSRSQIQIQNQQQNQPTVKWNNNKVVKLCVCVCLCVSAPVFVLRVSVMKILNKFLKKHIWKILNLTKEKDTEKAKEQATSNELKFFRAEERKQRLQKAGSAVEEVPKGKEEQ